LNLTEEDINAIFIALTAISLLIIVLTFIFKIFFSIFYGLYSFGLCYFIINKIEYASLSIFYNFRRNHQIEKVPFYQRLSPKNKQIFNRRVNKFLSNKEFFPRGGLKTVSNDLKELIAAHAITVTWGYPALYLNHFKKFVIYPDNYYSTIRNQYHQGEVNVRGFVVLSITNIERGIKNNRDGINLLIHEFGHALILENKYSSSLSGFLSNRKMSLFHKEAIKISNEIVNNNVNSPLRDSATSNFHELCAVSCELFFENHAEMASKHNSIFQLLTQILKIDFRKL